MLSREAWGLLRSEGLLQEKEEATDNSEGMFSTIPSESQSRKTQDRDIAGRMTLTELTNKDV